MSQFEASSSSSRSLMTSEFWTSTVHSPLKSDSAIRDFVAEDRLRKISDIREKEGDIVVIRIIRFSLLIYMYFPDFSYYLHRYYLSDFASIHQLSF